MTWTGSQLVSNFIELGIKHGDSVVVHSSYKNIGNIVGGPRTVIDALREIIFSGGALLFPNLIDFCKIKNE